MPGNHILLGTRLPKAACVLERGNQGLSKFQLMFYCYKCCYCVNELQRIKYSWEKNPNLECFYLVIQGGSIGMNNVFELPPKFVTWDSKLTSTQRPFWEYQSAKIGFKFSPILTDLCHILFYAVH